MTKIKITLIVEGKDLREQDITDSIIDFLKDNARDWKYHGEVQKVNGEEVEKQNFFSALFKS